MQPNAEDVMKTNINKNYGKYVKKIINSLDKKNKKEIKFTKGKTKKIKKKLAKSFNITYS